jgi:hypothetical protein
MVSIISVSIQSLVKPSERGCYLLCQNQSHTDYHGEMVLLIKVLFQKEVSYLLWLLNWTFMSIYLGNLVSVVIENKMYVIHVGGKS